MFGRTYLTLLLLGAMCAAPASAPPSTGAAGAPERDGAAVGAAWHVVPPAGWWLHWPGGHHGPRPAPHPTPTPPAPTPPAPTPPAPASGYTVTVTIPTVFTFTVLRQEQHPGRCDVLLAVTDNRAGNPGWALAAHGGGRGTLWVEQVPDNGLQASDVQVGRSSVSYPAGRSGGSVRVHATFASCPGWTLL